MNIRWSRDVDVYGLEELAKRARIPTASVSVRSYLFTRGRRSRMVLRKVLLPPLQLKVHLQADRQKSMPFNMPPE